MIKTVLFIAASLDAYIAKPDGNLDWLTSFPVPSEDDYGYSKLLSNTETIIMGRKTYEEVIGFGIEWQYNGIETYVVSSNKNLKIQTVYIICNYFIINNQFFIFINFFGEICMFF